MSRHSRNSAVVVDFVFTRLSVLVDRLVADGVHAVAPLDSTGELAYLGQAEFEAVVDTTIAAVDGRVLVVVGVSNAVMILPVSYWKLAEREIFSTTPASARPSEFRSCVQQPGREWNRYDAGVTDSYVSND